MYSVHVDAGSEHVARFRAEAEAVAEAPEHEVLSPGEKVEEPEPEPEPQPVAEGAE